MDGPDIEKKLRRMAKYFPAERIVVLEKEEYYALRRDLRNAFEWERMEGGVESFREEIL